MSYDYELLYLRVSLSLQRKPNSSLRELSRELRVSGRTIERTVLLAARKTFSDLRKGILLECVTTIFVSRPTEVIKKISFELGYKSPRSFSRAIKRACGSSPAELRSDIIRDLVSPKPRAFAKAAWKF